LCFAHFIYDGIILPSIRLKFRYRLFRLRDELRELKVLEGEKLEDTVFHYLQGSINNAIRMIPRSDIATALRAKKAIEHDSHLAHLVEKRKALIEQCPIDKVREIEGAAISTVSSALLANNGMLCLYFLPFALLVMCLVLLGSSTGAVWKPLTNILYAPESKL